MAVRDRSFHRYAGAVTPRRGRFLVLWRYGRREVFSTKIVTGLFALSFAPALVAAVVIYLRHNLSALAAMELDVADIVPIDANFFYVLLRVQAAFSFLLGALVGPGLISPDLANNGLPLYLARPFSRAEYVLGKLSVLVILTSSMTWLPLLVLVALQAGLEPGWLGAHAAVPWAIFAGSWVWILFLSLLALALSAWVKWRIVAAAMLFAVVLIGSGLAEWINALFDTGWGDVLSPGRLFLGVWQGLFFGDASLVRIPLFAAWTALGAMVVLCLLILNRKLQAYEVVR